MTKDNGNCQCKRSGLAKYVSRPGPPYPANDPNCRGKHKLGNDGQWYRSVPDKRGIHTWKKSGAPQQLNPREPPKRKRSPSVIDLTRNKLSYTNRTARNRTIVRKSKSPSRSPTPSPARNSAPNVPAWTPMLAQTLNAGAGVPKGRWFASEKLDGVRAFWDGKGALWTRSRNRIDAPSWFIAELPRGLPLDGELFAGRGQFGRVNGAWRTAQSEAWPDIEFRAFDAPTSKQLFGETYDMLRRRLETCRDDARRRVCLVDQTPLTQTESVQNMMRNVLGRGGEGLMLRRADSMYAGTRSMNMLKVKDIRDAEGIVTGYKPGTGRLEGSMGALQCRWDLGNDRRDTFYVGTGFSDAQRRAYKTLFPIGTKVIVEFMELTAAGKPRHPRFKGVRSNI